MENNAKLTVRDVMNGVLLHADVNETVANVIGLMHRNNADAIIIRENGVPKGIITATDIVKYFATSTKNPNEVYAKEIMRSDFDSIDFETGIDAARDVMSNKRLRMLPVKQEFDIIGLLTPNDLM